jgi:hypothetical protein
MKATGIAKTMVITMAIIPTVGMTITTTTVTNIESKF